MRKINTKITLTTKLNLGETIMANKAIPEGFHTITPYIVVKDANKLIDFLIQAFDAKENCRITQANGAIAHAQLLIGDSFIMLGETKDELSLKLCSIYLYVKNTDTVYQKALQAGATSIMEPADQIYGDRNAGVKDPCGNSWWIATHIEDVTLEEVQKRTEALHRR